MKTVEFLEKMSEFRRNFVKNSLKYSCFEEFVLKNGKKFEKIIKRPSWVNRGEIKECFSNCFSEMVSHKSELTYCEGYAFSGLLPVHHAWLLYEGKVIDPTWEKLKISDLEYFGVAFSNDYVISKALSTGYYGVLDNFVESYPLLSGIDVDFGVIN